MTNSDTANPLVIIGLIIFILGILIFCFGKKFIFLRYLFGDRSMFSQLFWGGLISLLGLVLLYFSGAFQ